jgi:hypothetical protein
MNASPGCWAVYAWMCEQVTSLLRVLWHKRLQSQYLVVKPALWWADLARERKERQGTHCYQRKSEGKLSTAKGNHDQNAYFFNKGIKFQDLLSLDSKNLGTNADSVLISWIAFLTALYLSKILVKIFRNFALPDPLVNRTYYDFKSTSWKQSVRIMRIKNSP